MCAYIDSLSDILAAVDVERVARDLDFPVLQDNIEHIALCNIDMEVVGRMPCACASSVYDDVDLFKDSRAMDPNFIKLYKMAQLIIEYLLVCFWVIDEENWTSFFFLLALSRSNK